MTRPHALLSTRQQDEVGCTSEDSRRKWQRRGGSNVFDATSPRQPSNNAKPKPKLNMNRELLILHGLTKDMKAWLEELPDIGITAKRDEYELQVAFRSWIAYLEQIKDVVGGDDVMLFPKKKKSREQSAHSNQNK
jgi:hypothetical protein